MMTGFEQYTRKTRRAIFLEEMEQVVPWRELCALVEPHYPTRIAVIDQILCSCSADGFRNAVPIAVVG